MAQTLISNVCVQRSCAGLEWRGALVAVVDYRNGSDGTNGEASDTPQQLSTPPANFITGIIRSFDLRRHTLHHVLFPFFPVAKANERVKGHRLDIVGVANHGQPV